MQQPSNGQEDARVAPEQAPERALDTALAHARAAGALARLALAPAPIDAAPLAEALDARVRAGDTPPVLVAAAGFAAARQAAGAPLTTHTLRLVAEALADPSDAAAAGAVEADLRRAAHRTPRERAPLATAFSGLGLLTRVLAARTGRDFTLTVDAGDAMADADQLDQWRKAAMVMAEFILDAATESTVSVELSAAQACGAIRLSARLPDSVRVQPTWRLADALIRALEDETADPMIIDERNAFAELEAAAAELGGSAAVETLEDGGQRLVLLAGRPAWPAARPNLRTVSSRPVRRAARTAA